eukprot:TRINITY_DN6305_c0_g1_i2.p1 TRINITY_DN6305_c0_g1~~TRINITY_DN6305_c0_g1_i2.p1  ORF type:complete len:241 (+),score=49.74 TRINITY_DN6305_c0_g1_i2:98-820(+)
MAERAQLLFLAKICEQAEQYDDMIDAVKKIAKTCVDLTSEERNLLSVAYKNVVGAKRSSWRIVSQMEQKEDAKRNDDNVTVLRGYRAKLEKELQDYCSDIAQILDRYLIPQASSNDARVFYQKMKADYFRYMAEFSTGSQRKDAAEQSLVSYKTASDFAVTDLAPTHPLRLGLALNFSVFYFEILNAPDRACRLAKTAFDDAMGQLDGLDEEEYKDSTLVMQLLRDNLTLWASAPEPSRM